ncbi:LysR family transcriptional regulator [Leucothrix arctica]|uniref:HTH lysR-type domain-containing protein n=1 Tax=Leucothrix arctica TaxID=1481894 RepID=A0A317CJ02_9GAMM|nr:LysR family transcriptional regulator [Leucothrix arctica]PWQ98476.1 hypothetical protein DKT75_03215 [Leucothrix arctica]
MKHSLPPLESLKVFEAAARHLSFLLAAKELCVSKGAVSYQIRKLEEDLQCKLFKRSIRQIYLTEAGQLLFQTTRRLFQELEHTVSKLKVSKQQANVTIAATTYVAARWLSSRISRFNEAFPNINIMLQHTVDADDFKLDDVDLAIIWGPRNDKLDKDRFAKITMPLFPVISPRLLETHNISSTQHLNIDTLLSGPLKNIPLLCEDREEDMWQDWLDAYQLPDSELRLNNPRRTLGDANVRAQAAVDGQGLVLADELMLNELNNGLLIRLFKKSLNSYSYDFYAASTRMYSDNAMILRDWIAKDLEL